MASYAEMRHETVACMKHAGAEGVPSTDKFQIKERRARVCLIHAATKTFVGGAYTVNMSRTKDKDKESTEWKFTHDPAKGNPFLVRAPQDADYELYIELSFLAQKKGTQTTGQQAISCGDLKEFSAGFVCVPLGEQVKTGNQHLPLFGGTPWARVPVKASDLQGQKKSGGLFARFKRPVSQVSVKIALERGSAELDLLPSALVCHDMIKQGLAEFCKVRAARGCSQLENKNHMSSRAQ